MDKKIFRNLIIVLIISLAFIGLLFLSPVGGGGQTSQAAFTLQSGASPVYIPLVFNNYPLLTVFGSEMNSITDSSGLQQMAGANAYWVRRNGVKWSNVQSNEGQTYDWSVLASLESELIRARSNDMSVILIVRGTPDWAQAVSGYECGPIAQEDLTAFGDFMSALVQRYSVAPYYVKYWEIWNEPDIDPKFVPKNSVFGCWGDDSDPYYGGGDYAGMLKTVYPKIKAANPEAQVLVGGLLLDCDPVNPPAGKNCTPSKYLEGILQNGGGSYFDGVSFHAYDFYNSTYNTYGSPNWNSGRWANETDGELKPVLIAKVSYLKNLLNSYGASNKFLINTEVALLCGGGSDPPGGAGCESDPTSPYELLKAYYISQAYAAAIAEGLLGNIWYSPTGWRNSGLLNPDLSTRPAYDAYALARSTLKNATLLRTITEYHDPNNVFGYEFSIDGRRIWVVWVLDGSSQTIALPASSSSVSAWDALGVSVDVSSGNLAIGALNTVYVEWIP